MNKITAKNAMNEEFVVVVNPTQDDFPILGDTIRFTADARTRAVYAWSFSSGHHGDVSIALKLKDSYSCPEVLRGAAVLENGNYRFISSDFLRSFPKYPSYEDQLFLQELFANDWKWVDAFVKVTEFLDLLKMKLDIDCHFETVSQFLTAAYFITPSGVMISTNGGTHIGLVIDRPEIFGLTDSQVRAVYQEYNEPVGLEGKARAEIIKFLIGKGWTRIRRYPNEYWSIQVKELTKTTKDYLYDFTRKIQVGVGGFIELDNYFEVKIACVAGINFSEVGKISAGDLYSPQESKDQRQKLIFVESIDEL